MVNGLVQVLVAVLSIAALAVVFGKNARTAQVLTAGGQALGGLVTAAQAPVLDAGVVSALRPNVGYGSQTF